MIDTLNESVQTSSDIPQVPPPQKKSKKTLAAILIVLFLVLTLPIAVYLSQQQQDIRQRAQTYDCREDCEALGGSNCSVLPPCLDPLCSGGFCAEPGGGCGVGMCADNSSSACQLTGGHVCCPCGGGNPPPPPPVVSPAPSPTGSGGNPPPPPPPPPSGPRATPRPSPSATPGTGGGTASPSPTPSGFIVPSPTPTPPPECNQNCTTNADCPSSKGLICLIASGQTTGTCKHTSCTTDSDCVCPGSTSTSPSPTPSTTPNVPKSGTSWPTVALMFGGVIFVIISLAL